MYSPGARRQPRRRRRPAEMSKRSARRGRGRNPEVYQLSDPATNRSHRSGRSRVRRRRCSSLQAWIRAWSPDRSTSGTLSPRYSAGLVYTGLPGDRRERLVGDRVGLPTTPGRRRGRPRSPPGPPPHRRPGRSRRSRSLVDARADHPLVDPFVPAAHQREVVHGRQPVDRCLVEGLPPGSSARCEPANGSSVAKSGSTASPSPPLPIRRVVHLAVLAEPVVADVV